MSVRKRPHAPAPPMLRRTARAPPGRGVPGPSRTAASPERQHLRHRAPRRARRRGPPSDDRFEVKDEVLTAALKWASEQLFVRLEQLAAGAGGASERLAQLLEASLAAPPPALGGEYMLWMELWVRALHEPSLLPEVPVALPALAGILFDTVRRGVEDRRVRPRHHPTTSQTGSSPSSTASASSSCSAYQWTSPERMRAKTHAFAAEQLEALPRGLERDARAAAAALEGGPG